MADKAEFDRVRERWQSRSPWLRWTTGPALRLKPSDRRLVHQQIRQHRSSGVSYVDEMATVEADWMVHANFYGAIGVAAVLLAVAVIVHSGSSLLPATIGISYLLRAARYAVRGRRYLESTRDV